MKGKYPFAIIFLDVDPKSIDVNVHPSKKIVKFDDEDRIYRYVLTEIEKSFERDDDFVSPTFEEKIEKESSKFLDFSEFEKFTPIKTEAQKLDNLIVENKDIKEEPEVSIGETEIVFEKSNEEKDVELEKVKPEVSEEETKELKVEVEKKEEIKVVTPKKKIDFRVIGQVFNTFILVEREGVFEIYDQHIVHERILYEKLKKQYYGTDVSRQQLLVPIRLLVDPRERELIFEEEENFSKAGFEIDRFSDDEILIRAIPIIDLRDSVENIFRNILKNIKENKNIDIRESILISMSCKGAIKANERLNHEEMEKIVRELHEVGEYTCPHGRPIIVKITPDDLEKLFKRK